MWLRFDIATALVHPPGVRSLDDPIAGLPVETPDFGGREIERSVPHGPELELRAGYMSGQYLLEAPDGRCNYTVPVGLALPGPLDRSALTNAVDDLVLRHSALRTSLRRGKRDVLQVIAPGRPVPIAHHEVGEADRHPAGTFLPRVAQDVDRPFDLSRELFRVTAYATATGETIVMLVPHHAVVDLWSRDVLHRDFVSLYEAHRAGLTPELPDLRRQFRDFTEEDWRREAQGHIPSPIDLSADSPLIPPDRSWRPSDEITPVFRSFSQLDGGTVARLTEIGHSARATLPMVLRAALISAFGHRRHPRVVVGITDAMRYSAAYGAVVGCFAQPQVISIELSRKTSILAAVKAVKRASLERVADPIPFGALQHAVGNHDTMGRRRLFEFEINYLPKAPTGRAARGSSGGSAHYRAVEVPLSLRRMRVRGWSVALPIHFLLAHAPDDGLRILMGHDRSMFSQASVNRLAARWTAHLADIVRQPEQPLPLYDVPL